MAITYTTKYSERRKTLGLVVERDKSIVVLAPTGTRQELLDDFVERKKFWLFEKINYSPKLGEPFPETPFVSGKAIPYLGKNYKLDTLDEMIEGIIFNGKFLISKSNLIHGKAILEQWYKQKAKEKITPMVQYYAQQLGVAYNDIFISDLKYRWGSCTLKGNLNFNWRLIKTPQYVIKYIVIHELSHLLELNHSDLFWTIVKVQMPNYLEAKEWLKENGEWVF
jgi:predicted metal-dependent hydrolase